MTEDQVHARAALFPRDRRMTMLLMTAGAEVRAPARFAAVEQFLIRGLDTACQVYVVGLPRSHPRRSALPLPKLLEDSPDRTPTPGRRLRCRAGSGHLK
jgi:hypothetical protein